MVELVVGSTDTDLVSDWLWAHGASAVVEQTIRGVVVLLADLEAPLAGALAETFADAPADALTHGRIDDPSLEQVISARVVGGTAEDRQAARTWRDFAEPVTCGRVVIVPEWLAGERPGPDPAPQVELLMEPGEAFGAGTHVTTRLCLESVGDLVSGGELVLDFGCGTGILGVAAAMLGAERVVALDIEDEAVRVTRELARRNGVADLVEASTDPLAGISGRFDLVFANVLIGVIEEWGRLLVDKIAPAGALIVSGILPTQRERALVALWPLSLADELERDGWLRLTLRRPVT